MANRASRHSMTKWHPRKSDGKAVRCEADVRKCPRTKEGEVHVYANTPGEAQRKIDAIKAEYAGDGLFATASTSNPSTTVTPPTPTILVAAIHRPQTLAMLQPVDVTTRLRRRTTTTPRRGKRGSRCPSLNRGASANAS